MTKKIFKKNCDFLKPDDSDQNYDRRRTVSSANNTKTIPCISSSTCADRSYHQEQTKQSQTPKACQDSNARTHQVGVKMKRLIKMKRTRLYLPFLIPLQALRVELLDSNDHAGATLGRVHRLLIHPSLVHPPKPSLPEDTVWPEVLGSRPELEERERAEVRRLQDLALEEPTLVEPTVGAAAAGGGGHEAAAPRGELPRGAVAGRDAAACLGVCRPCRTITTR